MKAKLFWHNVVCSTVANALLQKQANQFEILKADAICNLELEVSKKIKNNAQLKFYLQRFNSYTQYFTYTSLRKQL